MSQSTSANKEAMAQTIAATQQGDNIAHALAGAGGGLLSMSLTSGPFEIHSGSPTNFQRL